MGEAVANKQDMTIQHVFHGMDGKFDDNCDMCLHPEKYQVPAEYECDCDCHELVELGW